MFTGIITHVGRILSTHPAAATDAGGREGGGSDLRVRIDAGGMDLSRAAMGASIACSGVCLTLVDKDVGAGWFAVDVSGETEACTAPGAWAAGRRLNLEPALRLGDELGGHLVTGHVDGLAHIVERQAVGGSTRFTLSVPRDLGAFIAAKGSVTLDGVSLTVNAVADAGDVSRFAVNIIPHTAAHTSLSDWQEGEAVHVEIDVLARYLKRMAEAQRPA